MPADRSGRGNRHTPGFCVAVFLIGLATVVLAGSLSFPRIGSSLFFSWDSAAYVGNAKEYLDNGTLTELIASYTQSFGNLAFPINVNLMPEVRFAYIGGRIDPVVMFVLATAFFFVSTFGVVVMTGFGPLTALLSGWTMVLLTMPFTSPPIYTNSFWWDTPGWIPLIYMFAALIVTFRFIGRLRPSGNLLAILLLYAEVMWIILGPAKGGFVVLFGAAWLCIAIMAASDSLGELGWKSLGGLAVAVILLLTGSLEFIRGLYAYTGNLLFLSSLETFDPLALLKTLFFFHRGLEWLTAAWGWIHPYLGIPLTVLSIGGAIWTMISPPTRIARSIAIALLTVAPILVYFIYGGPIAGTMYPLLVMFAVVCVVRGVHSIYSTTLRYLPKSIRGSRIMRADTLFATVASARWVAAGAIVITALGLVFLAARYKQAGPDGWRYPPSRHPLIDRLATDIRFRPGDQFRGRYLDMSITIPMETGVLPSDDWLAAGLMKTSWDHVTAYGNDLTIHGPRFYDIPVAMEANRMNTPLSVLFQNFLLIEEGQKERVDFRQITHFDLRLFRLLGIRYVLSHRPLDGRTVANVQMEQLPVRTALYEIRGINRGQYSPTAISMAPEWRAALETIAAVDFDPARMALLHDSWLGNLPLEPATEARILRTHDGYRVVASSAGRSLLVLPFEFSRCLVASDKAGTSRIGRVDFLLTGLVFEKKTDTELRFRFGPFENSGCRLADLGDFRAMGFSQASFAAFMKKYPKRFEIGGVF